MCRWRKLAKTSWKKIQQFCLPTFSLEITCETEVYALHSHESRSALATHLWAFSTVSYDTAISKFSDHFDSMFSQSLRVLINHWVGCPSKVCQVDRWLLVWCRGSKLLESGKLCPWAGKHGSWTSRSSTSILFDEAKNLKFRGTGNSRSLHYTRRTLVSARALDYGK